MALIQINQKLLHITITLLIYGVRIESVKCPEFCHCVETSVFYNLNNTKTDFDILDISDKNGYQHLDISKRSLPSEKVKRVSYNKEIVTDKKEAYRWNAARKKDAEDAKQTKTLKNKKKNLKDIFIHNFSTDPAETFLIKNSKHSRTKRTLKRNANEAFSDPRKSDGQTSDKTGDSSKYDHVLSQNLSDRDKFRSAASEKESQKNQNSKDKKNGVKEIFTYQITCNQVRDLKALWFRDLPSPTTQLIIQQAYFQSVKTFHQILKETSARLDRLTDLSVTDCIINGKEEESSSPLAESTSDEKAESLKTQRREEASRKPKKTRSEFLPFASLQNPKLRTEPDPEPSSYSDGNRLQILNLSNNTLAYLPKDAFRPFPNLQTLDLSNNLITRLDDEIFNPLGNLLRLDLHNNRLKSLNEVVFKNLTKLLTLDVSQNSITNFPPSTFEYLASLNTLILADNPLATKQEAVILLGTGKRLQIVDVSKTGLKQIPGTLERSVRTLNLKGNYLSSIQCGDLDSYSLLTYLDLRDNKISYVEDDALGRLELLNNLQINENNLFQIPKSLPNNLEILNLSYNNIQNITNSDFLNLSLLKELSLSYNQLSNIEENSFDSLVRLKILDLSHNPILVLPNMYGLVELTILNLSYFTNIPNNFRDRYEEFPAQSPEKVRVLNLESSPILTKVFLQDTKTLQSFVNLRELYLRFSNLTTLRKDIFNLLPKLATLKIEGNPWDCNSEILKLSDWLKIHEKEAAFNDENEINTAHCATPPDLYKKPLISLTFKDFGGASIATTEGSLKDDPTTPYMEIEKLATKNLLKNQTTLKKIQEIQSKDRIHLKSFQKPIDYSDKKIEDMSNTSRGNKIYFARESSNSSSNRETNIKKDKETDFNVKLLLNYNKTEHKRVISGPGEGKCCGESEKGLAKLFGSKESSTAASTVYFLLDKSNSTDDDTENGTSDNSSSSNNNNNNNNITTAVAVAPTATSTGAVAETTAAAGISYDFTEPDSKENASVAFESTTLVLDADSTETSKTFTETYDESTRAESVLVKETLSSEKHDDSHPGFFVLFFVGSIMIATLVATFLHFAKTRRDRNYQRQNQDIEVRSISGLGNELW